MNRTKQEWEKIINIQVVRNNKTIKDNELFLREFYKDLVSRVKDYNKINNIKQVKVFIGSDSVLVNKEKYERLKSEIIEKAKVGNVGFYL